MAHTLEYVLVTTPSPDELARLVTQRLADGWQLYGNPVIGGAAGASQYAQALVRDVATRPTKFGPV